MARASSHWMQDHVAAHCESCDWRRHEVGGDSVVSNRVVSAARSHARRTRHNVAVERAQTQAITAPASRAKEERLNELSQLAQDTGDPDYAPDDRKTP